MLPQNVTNEQISSVTKALENLADVKQPGDGEFLTIMYIEDSTDGMGLTTLTSPTHFKTVEGPARYIVTLIDPGEYSEIEEVTDETAEEWISDNVLTDSETEEPGHYVIFTDSFSD